MPRFNLTIFSLMIIYSFNLFSKDPLSEITGTENWKYIDTSKVKEEDLWKELHLLIIYCENLKQIFLYEKEFIRRLRESQGYSINKDIKKVSLKNLQSTIELLRSTYGLGKEIRDEKGQIIDEEKPWEIK